MQGLQQYYIEPFDKCTLIWCSMRKWVNIITLNKAFVMLNESIQDIFTWGFMELFQNTSSKIRVIIFESS